MTDPDTVAARGSGAADDDECACSFPRSAHENGTGRVFVTSATGSEVNRCFVFRPICTCGTRGFDGEPFAGYRPDCPAHRTARAGYLRQIRSTLTDRQET